MAGDGAKRYIGKTDVGTCYLELPSIRPTRSNTLPTRTSRSRENVSVVEGPIPLARHVQRRAGVRSIVWVQAQEAVA